MIRSCCGEHPGQATASQPTAWRALEAIADDDVALTRMEAVLGEVRAHVWGLPGGAPPVLAQAGEPLCVSIWTPRWPPSTRKRTARRSTDKHTFSYTPIWRSSIVAMAPVRRWPPLLRSKNAGSNTAADHIELLDATPAGLPAVAEDAEVVVRGDVGYAVTEFLAQAVWRACEFSVGCEITEAITTAICQVAEAAWQPALTADGNQRDRAHVVELTHAVALPDGWPEPAQLIVRREPPTPAPNKPSTTSTAVGSPPCSPTRPSSTSSRSSVATALGLAPRTASARFNQLGLANLPCGDFARNAAWLQLTLVALNLLAWTQALTLDGELARAEPKRFRDQLAHTAARITHTARRTTLALAADWRWTPDLLTAFARLRALPPAPP